MKGTVRLLKDMPEVCYSHNLYGEIGERVALDVSLLRQKHGSIKKILRSYGVSMGTKAPDSVINNMIERGMAQDNERLCPNCYKIFNTDSLFCQSCQRTRNDMAKIKNNLRKGMKMLK